MFFYEGQKCPVCGNYFGEQDDIVTCPECGAPHHRHCWKAEGHCHFAELHGTGKQWHEQEEKPAPTTKKRCMRCGYDNPEFSEFCARCGLDLGAEEWHTAKPPVHERPPVGQYTPPPTGAHVPFGVQTFGDPYGGVPRSETIDGVPVDTIAKLVGPNSAYYLPRFYRMTHGGSKIDWNWMALLLPYNWLLYRKNILWGIVSFVALTVVGFFSNVVNDKLLRMLDSTSMEAMMQAAQTVMASREGQLLWGMLSLASLLTLVLHLLLALFGNYLYLRTILRKAKKLNGESPSPYDQSFQRSGGVSFVLAALPYLLALAVSSILTMFL